MSNKEPKPFFNAKNFITVGIMLVAAGVTIMLTYEVLRYGGKDGPKFIAQTVLPLIGTWMGAIIAYYFAKDNFNAAADRYDSVIDKLSPEDKLQRKMVSEAMIPLNDMKTFQLAEMLDKLILQDILNNESMKGLNRFIFMEGKKCMHIIHRSILGQFVNTKILNESNLDVKTLTLKHLINEKDETLHNYIHQGIVFLKKGSNLLDVKNALENNKFSEDAIITQNGKAVEDVLGWLPDTVLAGYGE